MVDKIVGFLLCTCLLQFCSLKNPDNNLSAETSERQEGKKELSPEDSDYSLRITEIDNRVKVFCEDSLIFDSKTIHGSPEVNYTIDLSKYILSGEERVRLELLNGVEPYNAQIDPYWEVRYDFIIKGEIVDFVHESGEDNGIGKVFEMEYLISEWEQNNN